MSPQTPAISAAIAVPTFRGIAILLIVTYFSVNHFDRHTASTAAIVFETAVPKSFHRLPRLGVISSVKDNFSMSLCASVGPVTSFLIMFSRDMLHEAVKVRNLFGDIPFPP